MNTLIQEGFVKEEIESEINVNKLSRIPNKWNELKERKKGAGLSRNPQLIFWDF